MIQRSPQEVLHGWAVPTVGGGAETDGCESTQAPQVGGHSGKAETNPYACEHEEAKQESRQGDFEDPGQGQLRENVMADPIKGPGGAGTPKR